MRESRNEIPLPSKNESVPLQKPTIPSKKKSEDNLSLPKTGKFIAITSGIVIVQFVLGVFGEVLPDVIKESLNEAATFFGLGYTTFWAICVLLLLLILIALTIPFFFSFKRLYFREKDDIEKYIKLKVLSEIPRIKKKRKKYLWSSKELYEYIHPTELIFHYAPSSFISEMFRELRTSIFNRYSQPHPKVILVSSPSWGEGKTTVATNLALALAATDNDVILIDANLHTPRLHNIFGISNCYGLAPYLDGIHELENLIQRSGYDDRLLVITSGPVPQNPSELLGGKEFKQLIKYLSCMYKYVIIDSPAALSFTDATIMANLADGVALVANRGASVKKMKTVVSTFMRCGANIIGVVFNRSKIKNSTPWLFYDYDKL